MLQTVRISENYICQSLSPPSMDACVCVCVSHKKMKKKEEKYKIKAKNTQPQTPFSLCNVKRFMGSKSSLGYLLMTANHGFDSIIS